MNRPGGIIKTHNRDRPVRSFAFLTNAALIAVAGYLALFARFGALVPPDQDELAIHFGALVMHVKRHAFSTFRVGNLAQKIRPEIPLK